VTDFIALEISAPRVKEEEGGCQERLRAGVAGGIQVEVAESSYKEQLAPQTMLAKVWGFPLWEGRPAEVHPGA
jgi:hypothetical protein